MKSEKSGRTHRIVIMALMTAVAMILSYIESLIPFFGGVPGMKLGLPNLAIVFLLYYFDAGAAASVNLIRIILTGLLFGNLFSILFSLAGALVSFAAMLLLKKMKLSLYGVSIGGGVFHNLGQSTAACLILRSLAVLAYAPVLLVFGIITGALIGYLASLMLKYVPKES